MDRTGYPTFVKDLKAVTRMMEHRSSWLGGRPQPLHYIDIVADRPEHHVAPATQESPLPVEIPTPLAAHPARIEHIAHRASVASRTVSVT